MSSESPRKRRYRYNDVVEEIRTMIQRGHLKIGDKLPPERTLAETLKVSRNSVRQAVQALAERKILESRQGDGTYVSAIDESPLTDSLALAIRLRKELLAEILEFRLLMEPQVAALAAKRITGDELDGLKIIVCDQQRRMLAGEDDSALDIAFHAALAQASQNGVVRQVMETVGGILNETRTATLQSKARRMASVEGHLKLIDALETRDSEMAFKAMKEHLSRVEEIVLGLLERERSNSKMRWRSSARSGPGLQGHRSAEALRGRTEKE